MMRNYSRIQRISTFSRNHGRNKTSNENHPMERSSPFKFPHRSRNTSSPHSSTGFNFPLRSIMTKWPANQPMFQRPMSYSSSSTTSKPTNSSIEKIKTNSTPKANSSSDPQKEAHQKAKALHQELQLLLDNQAKREAEYANQPWGTYLKHLLKTSRSELINIGAAFLCLVLALQIAGARRVTKRIALESENVKKELEEREMVMKVLRSGGDDGDEKGNKFIKRVGELCADALIQSQPKEVSGKFLGWSRLWPFSNGNETSDQSKKDEDYRHLIIDTITPIIRQEIQTVLGEYGMNETEKTSRELELLKSMSHSQDTNSKSNHHGNNSTKSIDTEDSSNGLDTIIGELQKASESKSITNEDKKISEDNRLLSAKVIENSSGETKVKKTRFVM